jgi:monofunctional biosynthetic peptidoglycan transglycosylase
VIAMMLLVALIPAGGSPTPESGHLVLDFREPVEWVAVNDGVMGGVSQGSFERKDGTAVFADVLSLENNGGFASVRFANRRPDLREYSGLVVRVRGDGRRYQLRLRDDRRLDGVAWATEFATRAGEWEERLIPFEDLQPTFRGRIVRGAGELDLGRIHQIVFMVADKKPGPFRLELEDLRGVDASPDDRR